MKIYPKCDENFNGVNILKPYIEKYKGVEIQFVSYECINMAYDVIRKYKEQIPVIEEITVHLPLTDEFNFETLAFAKLEQEKNRLEVLKKVSKEFNIRVNLIYHTFWNYAVWNYSGAIDRMNELLELIQNSNVYILIENVYSVIEPIGCWVFNVAKVINNKHLKVCLDTCHLHCQANIFKIPFDIFLKKYLNKEDCQNYIHQIHFSGVLNNDGFMDIKKTHGRVHNSWKSFEEDYSIIKSFGIEDKIIVSEVSENDYSTRKDQIEEIKMLISKEEN